MALLEVLSRLRIRKVAVNVHVLIDLLSLSYQEILMASACDPPSQSVIFTCSVLKCPGCYPCPLEKYIVIVAQCYLLPVRQWPRQDVDIRTSPNSLSTSLIPEPWLSLPLPCALESGQVLSFLIGRGRGFKDRITSVHAIEEYSRIVLIEG